MGKQIFVVTDDSGEIIAAAHAPQPNASTITHFEPRDKQKIYSLHVPDNLADYNTFTSANEFHAALTKHFKAKNAGDHLVTAETHPYIYRLQQKKKKSK